MSITASGQQSNKEYKLVKYHIIKIIVLHRALTDQGTSKETIYDLQGCYVGNDDLIKKAFDK